ncbi:MAG TPA: hypothetical protein VD789_03035 [Thermomicrobiales bacterium]|nr:hypothetical protein [Thermomicrobiales bacterium]
MYRYLAGALYALARRLLPRSPALAGVSWGGVIWAVTYAGRLPALRVSPRARSS